MLYLNNTPYPQIVMIPNNGLAADVTGEMGDFSYDFGPDFDAVAVGDAVMVLRSTTEKADRYAEIVVQIGRLTGLYYPVTAQLPAGPVYGRSRLSDGSYEYELKQGEQVLSRGCVQIGEYKPAAVQSQGGGVTFKQTR